MTDLFADFGSCPVHFIGVCGTAMAGVAMELHRSGLKVTGSDSAFYPPMSELLKSSGLPTRQGFSPDNLPKKGWIVVGNAVSRGNPELEAALDRRLPLISLPELIARRYLVGRKPIVVTGTHGKSTTTAMLAHILHRIGHAPGWMVGALAPDLEFPCARGQGPYFVIEGDEYDSVWWDKRPKFLQYQPFYASVNAVEFDHADVYPDLSAVTDAFRRFVGLLPQSGALVFNVDDARAVEVAKAARCRSVPVGAAENSQWSWEWTDALPDGLRGGYRSQRWGRGEVALRLFGRHNLRNALTALALAAETGVDPAAATEALKSFRGVVRRLQVLQDRNGITVWDDFAHHPTAIRETLTSVRAHRPHHRLWAFFEPRSNTMVRRHLQGELTEALAEADAVVIAPIHRADKVPESERLDVAAVSAELARRDKMAIVAKTFEECLEVAATRLRPEASVVIMSNGDFGGIKPKLMALL